MNDFNLLIFKIKHGTSAFLDSKYFNGKSPVSFFIIFKILLIEYPLLEQNKISL